MIPESTKAFIKAGMILAPLGFVVFVFFGSVVFKHWGKKHSFPGAPGILIHLLKGALIGFILVVLMLLVTWALGEAEFVSLGMIDSEGTLISERFSWGELLLLLFIAASREELIFRGLFFFLPLWAGFAVFDFLLRRRIRAASQGKGDSEPDEEAEERLPSHIPGYPWESLSRGASKMREAGLNVLLVLLLVIQAVLFALAHGGNPGVTELGKFNIFLAGILLGVLAIRAGSFWTALGAHWMVNLTYELFNLPISGYEFKTGWHPIGFRLLPPGIIGGNKFGLEGGLVCTGVISIAILALFLFSNVGQRKEGKSR